MDRIVKQKKGIRPKHIIWGVMAIAFVVVVYMAFTVSKTSTYRIEEGKITVDAVVDGDFNDYIRIMGYVEPIATIYLDAPEAGRVVERYIEEGAMVHQGEVILKLENKDMYLNILETEARLGEKQNNLRNTRIRMEKEKINLEKELMLQEYDIKRKKRLYDQNKHLFEDNLIPEEDFIRSKEDYEHAVQLRELTLDRARQDSMFREIEIKQLEDNLEINRKNLQFVRDRVENLNVKVPVDGQLSMLEAEIGQTVSRGRRIGQINVLTDYKIRADVDEHYIDRVRRDLTATLERNDKVFKLRVRKVYPEVRDGRFRMDLVFQGDRPENIRTGQSYNMRLKLGEPARALLLPLGGFFQSTGGQWVYVLSPEGDYATKRNIRIGKKNPQYYEILEGLEPGEKVITSGYDTFGDSDRIVLK